MECTILIELLLHGKFKKKSSEKTKKRSPQVLKLLDQQKSMRSTGRTEKKTMESFRSFLVFTWWTIDMVLRGKH